MKTISMHPNLNHIIPTNGAKFNTKNLFPGWASELGHLHGVRETGVLQMYLKIQNQGPNSQRILMNKNLHELDLQSISWLVGIHVGKSSYIFWVIYHKLQSCHKYKKPYQHIQRHTVPNSCAQHRTTCITTKICASGFTIKSPCEW